MNLAAIRTEVQKRGFDFVTPSSRIDTWINVAYQIDICEGEDWPFLEATATGAAPLTITDLRTIEYVTDTTQQTKLRPMDRRNITDVDYTMGTTGTPFWYYLTAGTVVNTYPVQADSLSIRYWKAPATLVADTDTPLLPSRFHYLIVEATLRRAYEDTDNFDAASASRDAFDLGYEIMRGSLLSQTSDEPGSYIAVYRSDDAA